MFICLFLKSHPREMQLVHPSQTYDSALAVYSSTKSDIFIGQMNFSQKKLFPQ